MLLLSLLAGLYTGSYMLRYSYGRSVVAVAIVGSFGVPKISNIGM